MLKDKRLSTGESLELSHNKIFLPYIPETSSCHVFFDWAANSLVRFRLLRLKGSSPKNLEMSVITVEAKIQMSAETLIHKFVTASSFAIGIAGCIAIGSASAAPEAMPEVVSRVWLENGSQTAAVTINGEEIVRFKADVDCDDAAEEADELAVKLNELLHDKKFDASALLPTTNDMKAEIKQDNNVILSFDPFVGSTDGDQISSKKVLEASTRLCNSLRQALGAFILPPSSQISGNDKAAITVGGASFSGNASWYGGKFNGRRCSDGSRFSEERLTAAHRSLPFGTKLLVKNRRTGATCIVEVNDRGPFIGNRVIDLSKAAARQLNMVGSGIALVDCQVLATND